MATIYDFTALTSEGKELDLADLRGKVAVVMQKAQLFGGTIRSNLLWGSQNASDADLWAALETAQASEFVKAKPLGLDEPVEQGGRNLSGGQKQRLTIARALVGKPDILILDDSASALDYATDAALRKALAALPGSLTVFIVSQRAASLQHADQILVLDDGALVGVGELEDQALDGVALLLLLGLEPVDLFLELHFPLHHHAGAVGWCAGSAWHTCQIRAGR